MTSEVPSWMETGNRGMKALSAGDAVEKKKDHYQEIFKQEQGNFAPVMSAEKAQLLGDTAIQLVPWKLKSDPFGVQAYALQRSGSSDVKHNGVIRGFGFFLEQGLGKTKTTLADFWNLFEAGVVDCMVVVTVNSMKATWRREMEDENYPFDIHVWPDFKRLPSTNRGQVVIINYEALFRQGGKDLFEWMRRGRPYFAADESTGLANHASKQAKAGVAMAGQALFKRMLAGKPNPMGPHNLWAQLKAMDAPVGNFYSFRNRFCVMGGYQGRSVTGQKNVDQLVQLMKPRTFFADKKTWATTLPDKKHATLVCEMTRGQKEAYNTMAKELYTELENGSVVTIDHTLHKALKLQQIASGFIYDDERKTHLLCKGEPPKITLTKDFVANASGKTIIFAHFQPTLTMLLEAFPGAPHALSKDRMSEEELEEHKARFNSDDCDLPFIASSSVLKFGHTLVGTPIRPCQNVLFAENTYSLLTRSQAEDRAHRWGASCDLITYYDIICSAIDTKMVGALQKRQNLAESLLTALKGFVDGD